MIKLPGYGRKMRKGERNEKEKIQGNDRERPVSGIKQTRSTAGQMLGKHDRD